MTDKQPRVKPDGKVVLINKGTATAPNVQIVPTVEDLNSGTDLTDCVVDGSLQFTSQAEIDSMREFAAALGVSADSVEAFVAQWAEAAERILEAPKKELLYRVNSWVRGIDPGPSQSWPGERGLR